MSDAPAKITSQMGQFGMVPVWVMTMPITDGEFRIYASIRSFCDTGGNCYPTTRTIAERARAAWVDDKGRTHPGCSVSAVRNAIAKFRDLGMMTTEPEYKPGTKIILRLRYHLADLDPRQWTVTPAATDTPADAPISADTDPLPQLRYTPYLSSGTQEQTTKQTKDKNSPDVRHRGSQPAAKTAPALPRRGVATPNSDPITSDTTADDAEAARIAENHGLEPEQAATLVRYLRADRNAATTAGYMRHLAQRPTGITVLCARAEAWWENLTAVWRQTYAEAESWGYSPDDARILADLVRTAHSVRCDPDVVRGVLVGGAPGGVFAAVAALIDGRRVGRVGRVVG